MGERADVTCFQCARNQSSHFRTLSPRTCTAVSEGAWERCEDIALPHLDNFTECLLSNFYNVKVKFLNIGRMSKMTLNKRGREGDLRNWALFENACEGRRASLGHLKKQKQKQKLTLSYVV